MSSDKQKLFVYFAVSILIVALDLVTKKLAETYLAGKSVSVIPGFFDLVLVWNTGAAFGILGQAPEVVRKLVLVGSSLVATIITTVYVLKKFRSLLWVEIVSLSLIAGGAAGNLYDRFFLGAVRDFLDFYVGSHHWPAFNVADASISVGIALFLFTEIYYKKIHRV